MSKMDEIIIGKYTLESLTNGMYASPFDLYREYVQNAADSIDDAVNREIIRKSDAKISIEIDHERHRISILDNGTGIEAEKAEELKQFSEIGVQRFFIRSREEAEEQELEEQLRKAQMEENNEY